MGVPSFFKWLSMRYPKSITPVEEDLNPIYNGQWIGEPDDQNVDGYDNLYIDMNGIIHNCSHSEDLDFIPNDEDDMIHNMFLYLDRLLAVVRPKNIFFIAIDGVAPRAKMNQQRSRRFRAIQESNEAKFIESDFRKELNIDSILPEISSDHWDSNVITPGTEFMEKVSDHLKYYIHDRFSSQPAWKNLKVIFSDSNVPGEGEHKIMDFIRSQRENENYNPNLRHVIHGLDADLIMLGLSTHEPHFSILREEVIFGNREGGIICFSCGQKGHMADQCQNTIRKQRGRLTFKSKYLTKPLQFIHLGILREYFSAEYYGVKNYIKESYNIESIIDDFIFICFFGGNDFIPHSPTLDIYDGAIGLLINIYKNVLPKIGGYLTNSGKINWSRLKFFIEELGKYEVELLKYRKEEKEIIKEQNRKRREKEKDKQKILEDIGKEIRSKDNIDEISLVLSKEKASRVYQKLLKDKIRDSNHDENISDDLETDSKNFKTKYYYKKFPTLVLDVNFKKKLVSSYLTGLQWILLYYYQGCCSWSWYYNYHYAPFASDLAYYIDDDSEKNFINFSKDEPYRPLYQLMAVLPPGSSQMLPTCYARLMLSKDSPIINYYPTRFDLDPNGKVQKWLWIALLPFINEKVLINLLEPLESQLTPKERHRNRVGSNYLMISKDYFIKNIDFDNNTTKYELSDFKVQLFASLSINEHIIRPGDTISPPSESFQPLPSKSYMFELKLSQTNHCITKLLKGVTLDADILTSADIIISEPSLGRTRSVAYFCPLPSWTTSLPTKDTPQKRSRESDQGNAVKRRPVDGQEINTYNQYNYISQPNMQNHLTANIIYQNFPQTQPYRFGFGFGNGYPLQYHPMYMQQQPQQIPRQPYGNTLFSLANSLNQPLYNPQQSYMDPNMNPNQFQQNYQTYQRFNTNTDQNNERNNNNRNNKFPHGPK